MNSAVAAEILKIGYEESPEHIGSVIFNLALEDENQMAIIVLGTLQMLLHELKTETRWSPYDAALALVHNNTCRYVGGSSVGNKVCTQGV
ncbi:hypothetical protein ACS0TY_005402 [Phlomoides rotata]